MHLVVIGVNHKTAPVELRERLAVDEGEIGVALNKLKSNPRIDEACVVSTCNRTEIYVVAHSKNEDDLLLDFLADYGRVERSDLDACAYCYPGHHAAKHLFEVASGLDSMALGETQILGQIKSAYCIADGSCSTGRILNNLFQRAITVGKRARTETRISSGAFSIGAAAVELARFVFGSLNGRTALLIGAGKMSKLATTHLKANGVEKVYVCSRTPARVESLVEELGGEAVEMEHLDDALCRADVVISSTSSREPVITMEHMQRVMESRPCAPIFLIDIAVPRDVEPEVAGMKGVFLYNIDDLRFLVDRSASERESEADKVREMISEETASFMEYIRTLEAVPLIKQLRAKFESVYVSEWERCSSKLDHLSDHDLECIRKAIKSAVTKLTHDPILRMKDYAANGGSQKLDLVRELFGLEQDPMPSDNHRKD
ncbi:MAG: glutamyl-tRNA reductase [Armatimonadota bacterium]|nr:glutamyl-tRNA reductase [bacterium]